MVAKMCHEFRWILLRVASSLLASVLSFSISGCTGPDFLEPKDMDPAWSPDSTQVAFVCYRHQMAGAKFPDEYLGPYSGEEGIKLKEICVADVDGQNRRQLTDNLAPDYDPSWSPDGTQIVFVSTRDTEEGAHVYVMENDGTNPIRLTQDAGPYRLPRWSPDAASIAFIRGSAGGDLYSMKPDGRQETRLTVTGLVTDFDWSPDGKFIVLSSGSSAPLDSVIYLINIETGAASELTDGRVRSYGPVWAPDSRQIAFKSERQGDVQIYVMDVENLEETKATASSGAKGNVSWSPDGQFLSYISLGETGPPILSILDRKTGYTTTFPGFDALEKPVWSPNGRYLIYERPEDWNEDGFKETKIWVLRVDDGTEWPLSSPRH